MKRLTNGFLTFILVVLFLQPTLVAVGQSVTIPSRASQYYLGNEDELLIPVNIWGFVKMPGQYMVPNNTDLVTLISVAGGPTESGKIREIRVVRSDPRTGNQIYRINVKKYLETADSRLIPLLKPGDTVLIKGTTFYWITKLFEFTTRIATIAQIFYFFALYQRTVK